MVAGWRIGRDTPTLRIFLLGIVTFAVFEALFGLANRNGPSTGIGTKVAYLGSATGTFINRGHFGAFLVLAIGALWGLAASLFPLLPEEVRRHRARKRRSSQPPGVLEASGDKVPRLVLIAFVSALCVVGIVASNSRGRWWPSCWRASRWAPGRAGAGRSRCTSVWVWGPPRQASSSPPWRSGRAARWVVLPPSAPAT